jgi:hypothetical protein
MCAHALSLSITDFLLIFNILINCCGMLVLLAWRDTMQIPITNIYCCSKNIQTSRQAGRQAGKVCGNR